MGTTIWIFIVDDDDTIQRFPLTRYLRLTERDTNERLPQYANTRVRFVEAAVELEQRKPVDILRLLYIGLFFDAEGRVDAAEKEKEWDLMPKWRLLSRSRSLNRSLTLGTDLLKGGFTTGTVGSLLKKWNLPLWRPYLDPPGNFWKAEALSI